MYLIGATALGDNEMTLIAVDEEPTIGAREWVTPPWPCRVACGDLVTVFGPSGNRYRARVTESCLSLNPGGLSDSCEIRIEELMPEEGKCLQS